MARPLKTDSPPSPEAWLRGPVDGVDELLQPVAHALIQASEDIARVLENLASDDLWQRPGGAASIGFHIQHLTGAIDRLLTYALGDQLSHEQLAAIAREGDPGNPPTTADTVIETTKAAIRNAVEVLKGIERDQILADRVVGRAKLPSTTLGILFHMAEHTTRHVGQAITTRKIIG